MDSKLVHPSQNVCTTSRGSAIPRTVAAGDHGVVSEAAWLACGAAALTGRADGPGLVPAPAVLERLAALLAPAPVADPWRLLTERAAARGWSRSSPATVGGAGRLLAAADGWVAVNLPRPDDHLALAAWLALPADPDADDPWPEVAVAVSRRPAAALVAGAADLGLAVAAMGEAPVAAIDRHPVGRGPVLDRPVRVVDLSALWAGPLCTDLLRRTGAEVVKVESTARPDGARADDSGFFDRLNAGKASVALDLAAPSGRAALLALLATADVVVESSRPRALAHLGVDALALLADPDGPRVWVSITGHGRSTAPGRIGFGDDAAVAGGLVVDDGAGPYFLADAVADPLTGVAAAAAVTESLAAGGRWLLDASLAGVAASVAGPRVATTVADPPPPPPPAPLSAVAAALGADTDRVLRDLQVRR